MKLERQDENRNFQFIIYLKYPIRLTSNNQLTFFSGGIYQSPFIKRCEKKNTKNNTKCDWLVNFIEVN